ncbi:MAG: hypothetical protein JKY68_00260, partial [Rhodospirillales bacterium]|nr:hypothetical protein [Rhodospirillales bacterium]
AARDRTQVDFTSCFAGIPGTVKTLNVDRNAVTVKAGGASPRITVSDGQGNYRVIIVAEPGSEKLEIVRTPSGTKEFIVIKAAEEASGNYVLTISDLTGRNENVTVAVEKKPEEAEPEEAEPEEAEEAEPEVNLSLKPVAIGKLRAEPAKVNLKQGTMRSIRIFGTDKKPHIYLQAPRGVPKGEVTANKPVLFKNAKMTGWNVVVAASKNAVPGHYVLQASAIGKDKAPARIVRVGIVVEKAQ